MEQKRKKKNRISDVADYIMVDKQIDAKHVIMLIHDGKGVTHIACRDSVGDKRSRELAKTARQFFARFGTTGKEMSHSMNVVNSALKLLERFVESENNAESAMIRMLKLSMARGTLKRDVKIILEANEELQS